MKSQQLDNNSVLVRTSCKDCVFAAYENNTQSSCNHDRINKFKSLSLDLVTEAYDEEKNFYVINKFCNFYRNKDSWNSGVADTNKVKAEAKLTFDLLINCDNIDGEYCDWILKLYRSIQQYGSDKISIHLYHHSSLLKESKKLVLSLCTVIKSYTLNVYFDKDVLEHNIISKSKKSYHIDISKENRVDVDILDKVNDLVNENLAKLLVVKNHNNYMYSNLSYKIHSANKSDSLESIRNEIKEYSKPEYYTEI